MDDATEHADAPPRTRSAFVPFSSLAGYRRSWLSKDILAGLTVWAVLVPEALAYATIAGVSPVVGLYAAPAALVLYAAFGSSRHLVTGPMAATAALSAAAVADLATGGPDETLAFTALLAIMTGVLALGAGLLRLGFLASFISEPVLKGFIIGLALTIIVGQLPKLFGVERSEGNFFEQLWGFLGDLGDTDATTLLVGAASLILVVGLRRFAPVLPGSLVAVVFGVLVVMIFGLDGDDGVAIVGEIESGLPSIGWPDGLSWNDHLATAAAAIGLMLVGFAEGLGAAKTYATRNHYEIDPNRELLGLGAANFGAGLSSGMIVNGSLSKTAVNGAAGARTQLSGLIVAALTVVTLLFLTGLFEDLPDATLAAIVIAAIVELVDFQALVDLYQIYTRRLGEIYGAAARADFLAAIAAMVGVLVFDTLPGLVIGIAVSVLLLLYRSSRPHIAELGRVPGQPTQFGDLNRHPDNQPVVGMAIVRVEAGLFYANADNVRSQLKLIAGQPDVHTVVLDAETVAFIDVTAARMLDELADDLDTAGVTLAVAHDHGQVRDVLAAAHHGTTPGLLKVYPSVQQAVDDFATPPT